MATEYNKPKENKGIIKETTKITVKVEEQPEPKKSIFRRIANAIVDPAGVSEIKVNLKNQVKGQASDAVKSIISSGLKGAVDAIFYGNSSISRGVNQRTNYSTYGGVKHNNYSSGIPLDRTRQRKAFNSRRYVIDNRMDAESVITALTGQILEYGSASVADFYNLIDIMSEYTDNSYGWRNIDLAESNPSLMVLVLKSGRGLL